MSYINLLDVIYPVGSVYLSTTNVSPAQTIGGSWQSIVDACLYAGNADIGYIGSKKISIEQMPSHIHQIIYAYYLRVGSSSGYQTMGDIRDDGGVIKPTQPSGGGQIIFPIHIQFMFGGEYLKGAWS